MVGFKLFLYLKQEPVFDDTVNGRLVREGSDSLEVRTYKFHPHPSTKDSYFTIHYATTVGRYSHDHQERGTSIDNAIAMASERGINLPESLIEKARREGIFLTADEELYRILQEFSPQLERLLWQYQPLLGVTRFTRGTPTHNVVLAQSLVTYLPPKEIKEAMIRLAQVLATKYDGLVWDKPRARFGRPSPKKRRQFVDVDYDSFNPRMVGWRWENISVQN